MGGPDTDVAVAKATTAAPVATTDPAQVSFSWSGSDFECSPLSNPSAPPPTPTDSLYDIHPRKSSFSSEYGMGAACAFPSWPNRASLSNANPCDTFVNNAFLSDEDLLWMPENPTELPILEEPKAKQPKHFLSSMKMEQQLELIRAAAEEEDRARFMAKVEAHARATQALRQAKVDSPAERSPPKSKKRRPVQGKRRAHSSGAKVVMP
ncbi:hypothetical protein N7470_008621 [Penicillium chermesinum]|nr:hypothetical protein N7470_008621 [Penicillium chermesinum]